jgi:glutamyl-tRNA synthetase
VALAEIALRYALRNAVDYGGAANPKAVTGKVMAAEPSLRKRPAEVARAVAAAVQEVNAMSLEAQRKRLEEIAPELLVREREVEARELPDLPNVGDQVVMRLAPYPSGPLHIGHARMAILNDEYVKRHGGRLILAYDDTIGSEEKIPIPEAYDYIREGLDWLGVECHETVYKSDRMPLFYEWGDRMIQDGLAYVCECPAEDLRRLREAGEACPHRDAASETSLENWFRMLDGYYGPGEAVVRLRTDMEDPDPAFRDRVLFRISDRRHPRVGDKYRVWPLLEFSWAVDDHLLGVTHILRGKDLMMEDKMERFIWQALGVDGPEIVHYGLLSVKEATLSKSKIQRLVEAGELEGVDDPRTWSLQSLERRGIRAEALREFVLSFGMSLNDITVPAETLYTTNRRLLDPEANRYAFVPDPVEIRLENAPDWDTVDHPLHPDFPERGVRKVRVTPTVLVAREDFRRFEGAEVRLKDYCNIVMGQTAGVTSLEVLDLPKIQWVSEGVPAKVWMPDGSHEEGVVETVVAQEPPGTVVQFERFGFVRLESLGEPVTARFAHR